MDECCIRNLRECVCHGLRWGKRDGGVGGSAWECAESAWRNGERAREVLGIIIDVSAFVGSGACRREDFGVATVWEGDGGVGWGNRKGDKEDWCGTTGKYGSQSGWTVCLGAAGNMGGAASGTGDCRD